MRIERVGVVAYALPFRQPYVTVRGRIERREVVLVRLYTDDGAVGVGEAAPMIFRGGPGVGATVAELRTICAPILEQIDADSLALPPGHQDAGTALGGALGHCVVAGASRPALAAVDAALHDLAGKLQGVPVWKLLGAQHATAIPCNATLIAANPHQVAQSASEWAAEGFETFKLKVQLGRERAQVAEVRQAVGAEARIRVDVNGAWSGEEAPRRARELEPFDVELLEEPAPDLESMAELRRATTIPVVADESVAIAGDALRAAELEACDAASVKLAEAGGMLAAKAIADSLPVYLTSALDGPIGIAAAASVYQALPREGFVAGLAQGLATSRLFESNVASSGWALSGGQLHPPSAPGLGVEIDEQALEAHRI